jgi:hypothetical protein
MAERLVSLPRPLLVLRGFSPDGDVRQQLVFVRQTWQDEFEQVAADWDWFQARRWRRSFVGGSSVCMG